MTIPVKGMVQRLSAYTAIRAREINAVTQEDYLRIVFYGQGHQERETAGKTGRTGWLYGIWRDHQGLLRSRRRLRTEVDDR
jgi:hypothetical protein